MELKYGITIENENICSNLKRIINLVYKLLPTREEHLDWQLPLNTIMEELGGMDRLFMNQQPLLFSILCKLEGLYTLKDEEDFNEYRRTIFECLNLLNTLRSGI